MKQQMASSAYHLKPSEVRKLFIAAPNFRDRCILKSLYWLGLRRQELIDLDIRDIDFTGSESKCAWVREARPASSPSLTRSFSLTLCTTAVDARRDQYSSPTRTNPSLPVASTTSWSR